MTAVYRGLLLDGALSGDVAAALDPVAESVSLFASSLLVAGLIWLRPFFTASSQAKQAIRESAERLQLVMDSALDAVVGMNASGHVTDWNAQAEAIFGWTRQQAVGRELSELVIPDPYRAAHRYGLRRYLDTGEAPILNRRIELTALSRDGREFPVELTLVPARSGDAPFFTAFVRDITDRDRAERQLARQALESRLLHQATMLASETDSFEDALRCCIDFVGKLTRWPVGHVYLPDAGRGRLIAQASGISTPPRQPAGRDRCRAGDRGTGDGGARRPGVGRIDARTGSDVLDRVPRRAGSGSAAARCSRRTGRAVTQRFSSTKRPPML